MGGMPAAAKTPAKALTSSWNAPAEGVSVVMVSYWTGPVLFAAIEAVLAPNQEGVVELIIVDNGNPPAFFEISTFTPGVPSSLICIRRVISWAPRHSGLAAKLH